MLFSVLSRLLLGITITFPLVFAQSEKHFQLTYPRTHTEGKEHQY